jgi:hypothetical protein
MPASLSISLSAAGPTSRAAPEHAAVARVQHLTFPARGKTNPSAATREVIVPGVGEVGVDLDPGFYNVQLILPTGRILQDYCEVVEGETQTVVFSDGEAADDPFSLQGLVGSDSPADVLDQLVKARMPATADMIAADIAPAEKASIAAERDPELAATPGDSSEAAAEAPSPPPAELRIGSSERLRFPLCWVDLARPEPPFPRDGTWQAFDSQAQHLCTALWHLPTDLVPPRERRWGVVQAHGCTELFSLPLPWRRAATFDEADVEVTVDPCAKGRSMTSVGIRDPQLEGLLGFLDRGRLGSARPVVEALDTPGNIREVILKKAENPLAACAAAYIGLAIFDPGEQERWDDWLPNIMNLFPDIPDGAIVHARRIILRPSGPEENEEALAALKAAYRAGIPFYSVGLQLMREMFSLFTDDEEARGMLEQVAQVASRVDPGQIFTVLRFPHR